MAGSESWDSTLTLLARAREGDEQALNDLFARYLPMLRRWASGRLPQWARNLADTPDIVQDTLLRTFKRIDGFDHRGEGAFQAYLRQAVMNRIRDELRSGRRRPEGVAIDTEIATAAPSPLEAAIGAEALDRYDAGLEMVSEEDRSLIVARIDLGLTYSEIAAATGRPTAGAARMAVARALVRLAEAMNGPGSSAD